MGKKTDQIEALTAELEATKILLRGFGDTVGVVIDRPITPADIPRYTREFTDAMRGGAAAQPSHVALAELAKRPRPSRMSGDWNTFDDHVDDQIDRFEAQGLTDKDGAKSEDEDDPLEIVANIAREIGVTGATPADTLRLIYEEVLRLKNPGDIAAPSDSRALAKGDTLGDAFSHAHDQNQHLREGVQQVRTVLQRIAAVMQVDRWDPDGTEICERAQTYEGWKHALKKRIKDLLAGVSGTGAINQAIAQELQSHLERLMTRRELVDWNKSRDTWVKRAAEAAAITPMIEPYPFTFRNSDLAMIRHALVFDEARARSLMGVFADICDSVVATDAWVKFMNRDLSPILARQRAAQRIPQHSSEPETSETSVALEPPPDKMGVIRDMSEVTTIPVIKDPLSDG